MNTESQSHSNVKLSAAQIELINEVASAGPRMDEDTYPYSEDEEAPRQQNTLTVSFDANGLPDMDDSAEDVDYDDDLFFLPTPSKKPVTAPVIESAPTTPTTPAIGDTVSFRYFRDPAASLETFEGTIEDKKHDYFKGWVYRIAPSASDTNAQRYGLTPRWVDGSYIKTIIATSKPEGETEDALYDNQLRLMKLVSPAFEAWMNAFIADSDKTEIARLSQAHTAAQVAYDRARKIYLEYRPMPSWAAQEGTTADIQAVQAYSSTMGDSIAAIMSTPASRALMVHPGETHPLRVVKVGSEESWNTLAAKRAVQYAEAKARVEKNKRMGGGDDRHMDRRLPLPSCPRLDAQCPRMRGMLDTAHG